MSVVAASGMLDHGPKAAPAMSSEIILPVTCLFVEEYARTRPTVVTVSSETTSPEPAPSLPLSPVARKAIRQRSPATNGFAPDAPTLVTLTLTYPAAAATERTRNTSHLVRSPSLAMRTWPLMTEVDWEN